MPIFLVTLIVFVAVFAGMAVGVMLARKPLKGTCGGLGAMAERFGEPMCDICDGKPENKPSDCSAPAWVQERCHEERRCTRDDAALTASRDAR